MGLLPKNERKKPMDTPRTFFIWGATMSGKSYLAERFPNPFFINTDDNAEKAGLPNFQLKNIQNPDGSMKQSVIDQLDELILELGTTNSGFETVVIDVIDDVIDLIEQSILIENNIKALSDLGYGKGYAMQEQIVRGLVLELKALPMNVVYVSRISEKTDSNGNSVEAPSLKTKWYNMVNGNSDLVIRTRRIGTNYSRSATDKRKQYDREQISDPKILRILENVPGVFPRQTAPAAKTTTNEK
ncbi:AAA family ATPase [Lacticaseibacillus brantae]|nr:AAA family ATPase [Lacticaseibacillus brantae]